jgi:hypothetical protein
MSVRLLARPASPDGRLRACKNVAGDSPQLSGARRTYRDADRPSGRAAVIYDGSVQSVDSSAAGR